MKKPFINDTEIEKGDILSCAEHNVHEEGVVVGYDGEKEELYIFNDGEGWTISKEFEGSLGNIYFK